MCMYKYLHVFAKEKKNNLSYSQSKRKGIYYKNKEMSQRFQSYIFRRNFLGED